MGQAAKVLQIETAAVFEPLLYPARYKGAHGGRGSGKSHFFAEMMIEDHIRYPGLRSVCIREVQKSLKESAKRLLEDKIQALGVSPLFDIQSDRIITPGGGVIIFQGMQDHTAESIKSLEGFRRAWVEEAQTMSSRSLELLRPTMREEDSELWFSWNPRTKNDPVDKMFREGDTPSNSVCVEANWSDNPWFPSVLERERRDCQAKDPDRYSHIWEGDYVTVVDGAYFAESINTARREGRITRLHADQLQSIRLFWDIGGTGAKADACSIWVAQFSGHDVKVLDYYEVQGQPLEAHLAWLKSNGYGPDKAGCWLPHDGATHDRVYAVSYESALRSAGYDVVVVPNQGRGAAMQRVEAVRRLFPRCWIDNDKCEAGLSALGWYHEKKDEVRGIGLGPDHDWSSHCFTGDTEVLTRYGMQRIIDLPETGEVMTLCGWKQYRNPRVTRVNAPLVAVRFNDGLTVRCTPDHMFLTVSGWISAQCLAPNTEILSTLTRSLSISMAVYTACGRLKGIYREAAKGFTGTLGRLLSGRSPLGATFTTRTMMSPITSYGTLNAWTQANTCQITGKALMPRSQKGSMTLLGRKPQTGMVLQREGYGTPDTQSEHRHGRSGSENQKTVRSATRHLMLLLGKAAILRSIALVLARLLPIGKGASRQNMHAIIESVSPLSETTDVWCMTVPEAGHFSLSNGAVVHNCADAFGLMAIVYKEPTSKVARKINFKGWG